jgi:hypothetical protein
MSSSGTTVTQSIVTLVMLFALAVVMIESIFLHNKIKKLVQEKLGTDTQLQKGTWFYIVTRGMQPRPLRIPKPIPRRKLKK